jgi:hypothetical protein
MGVVVYKTSSGFPQHSSLSFKGSRVPLGLCFLPGGDSLATLLPGGVVRITAIREDRHETVRMLRLEECIHARAIACSPFGELLESAASVDGRTRTLHVIRDDGDTRAARAARSKLLFRVLETGSDHAIVCCQNGSVTVPSRGTGVAYSAVTLFHAR